MGQGSSHGLRHLAVAAAVLIGFPLASLASPVDAGAAATPPPGIVTHYTDASVSGPSGITVGSDGALWFTNRVGNSIGQITTAGVVSHFTDPSINGPRNIAAGSDGALWFTNTAGNSIGRITTAGVVSHFTDPSISFPVGIAGGPDGALWFTNESGDTVGRITTAGVVTSYADASLNFPYDLAAGPDGAMWVTNANSGVISRITMGGTITHFTNALISGGGGAGITAGPDGAMWFTMIGVDAVVRMTMTGTITRFRAGTIRSTNDITTGPDGALWFADRISVGRITTAGTISNYKDASIGTPFAIAAGPDGALWFTNTAMNTIGRLEPLPIVVPKVGQVDEGNSGTVDLHIPVSLTFPSLHTVTVQWTTKQTPGAPAGQADPADDFIPATGTVTFAPGDTEESVTITVNGDTTVEPDEFVLVSFSQPTNAKVGGYFGLGFGRINNDD